MSEAFIYDHVRTPRGRGRPDGALHEISPLQLAAQVLAALRERSGLDTTLIDDVVMGVVSPIGEQGSVLPRLAAISANYAQSVSGVQLNRMCGSGLEAVNMAAAKVMAGACDAVIAGGVESMSRVPIGADGGAWHTDPAFAAGMTYIPQGIAADLIATLNGFRREDLDAYALTSQRRAAAAWAGGRFDASVVPVRDLLGEVILSRDEHMRPDTTADDLARLKPAFERMADMAGWDDLARLKYPGVHRVHHDHTGGNASGIVDGACAVLVGSRQFGRDAGLSPRARIRAMATIGSEPTIMLTGPAPVTRKVLKRAGMRADTIDLYEVNEAFAAIPLQFMRELDVPADRVNVNGGSIAMGHPLGATGAMLLGTALDELERSGESTALVTLCIGVGMGVATVIERV